MVLKCPGKVFEFPGHELLETLPVVALLAAVYLQLYACRVVFVLIRTLQKLHCRLQQSVTPLIVRSYRFQCV